MYDNHPLGPGFARIEGLAPMGHSSNYKNEGRGINTALERRISAVGIVDLQSNKQDKKEETAC
jgi:hypothetical protein